MTGGVGGVEPPPNFLPRDWDPAAARPRFSMGKRVRVRADAAIDPARAYVRGRSGVIERVCGHFGVGEMEPAALYRVRFALSELWSDDAGGFGASDAIDVELHEPWLEPFFDYCAEFAAETTRVAELVAAPPPSAPPIAALPKGDPPLDGALLPIGSALIAHAWTAPEFKALLLADASEASRALDLAPMPERLLAFEDTSETRNLIVPAADPLWRVALLTAPRRLLEPDAPEGRRLLLHDGAAQMRYLPVPPPPIGAQGWTAAALRSLVTAGVLIGVRGPKAPPG